MSAVLPTAAFLAECDAPMRAALLRAHAERLFVEAAQALAARTVWATHLGDDAAYEAMEMKRRHRESVRHRLRRLFDRADEFGINVGQPAKPKPKQKPPALVDVDMGALVPSDELDALFAGL